MITYRKYEDTDWQAICKIHDRARPDELKGSCDPEAFVPIEQDKEVDDLKRSKKIVACDDKKVVGFVGTDNDYLAWLYVDPDYYSKGIGRQLLKIGIREIGKNAWTIVLEGNKKAFALYESEGFIEFNRFEGNNAGYPCVGIKMKYSK